MVVEGKKKKTLPESKMNKRAGGSAQQKYTYK